MKTIGFPISHKENENRRALLPADLVQVRHPSQLFIEKGYGEVLGFANEDYQKCGVQVVSRDEVLSKSVICDPKIGDAEYLAELRDQTVFGWVHAVLNRDIADKLVDGGLMAYAWEDMYEGGRHVFWRNNEIAGEAAIMDAYLHYGCFPYNTKVAVIGRGNIARGAKRTLDFMGADVMVYDRHMESLVREELPRYDVVVNAILWDKNRKDHIIYRDDLKRMKPGAMIIDISCDRAGAIETSVPTTIAEPTYVVDGITHYVVDHTPSLFYKTTSAAISAAASVYFDILIEEKSTAILQAAKIVSGGVIIDQKIKSYQNR
jgi:N5-(carboxyethyl)ornithine synthase